LCTVSGLSPVKCRENGSRIYYRPFFDFSNYSQLYALEYHEVRGSNVQIISISEMYASVSVHFVSKGHITDSLTVTFSRFSTERYVSVV